MKKSLLHFMSLFSVLKKSTLVVTILVLISTVTQAQVTTNSGSGLAASYATLDAAITALNSATISSPVVITLAGNETAPVGGYSITAQGNATNTITIQGNGSVITANAALVAGVLTDGIFKLIGADYITLQGFLMQENSNVITAAATNNMTEWGVALLYASLTNGAQNNTIQNNSIALNRIYQNTFGIYANATHSATLATTSVTATGVQGGNSGLKIYANTVSNVNNGILIVGSTAVTDQNTGVDVGGNSLASGNVITNYGTTGTFSAFANVSGTVNGILVRNSNGTNISYNTVTSSVGGVTVGTLNGIQVAASSLAPTATFTNTINNNSISLKSAVATGTMNGINYPAGSASATSTLNVNSNDFNNFGHTVAASGTITFISTTSTNQFTTIDNNKFTNISVNTTGSVTFIAQSFSAIATATKSVTGNTIVTAFNKTGAGGSCN
jgi:trimeric autotransporter adhesin